MSHQPTNSPAITLCVTPGAVVTAGSVTGA